MSLDLTGTIPPAVLPHILDYQGGTMGRSFSFDQLKQTLRLAHFLEQHDLPTGEGVAIRDDMLARSVSRRQFLKGAATAAAVALVYGHRPRWMLASLGRAWLGWRVRMH